MRLRLTIQYYRVPRVSIWVRVVDKFQLRVTTRPWADRDWVKFYVDRLGWAWEGLCKTWYLRWR